MDKTITINQLDLFYQEFGHGKQNLLLLHGWGQSHAFWKNIVERLAKKYHLYVLDLPGFGNSQEPPTIWTVKDYAIFIHDFVKKLHIDNPIIIGHSFGGRIASVYASLYPVHKLILYSNGGLPLSSLRTEFNKSVVVNVGKFLFPNVLYKSHTTIFKPKEYQNKIILNTKRSRRVLDIYTQPFYNLTNYFKKITAPTLIIIGSNDYITTPKIGRQIHMHIKESQLIEIPKATHFAHWEFPNIFNKAVNNFLEKQI